MLVTRRQVLASAAGATAFTTLLARSGAAEPGAGHVVLLGDSVFDNKAYIHDGPAVIDQLRACLPRGFNASLLAVDGDTAAGVSIQMRGLPEDATHLVISAGGNDALRSWGVLSRPAATVGDGLLALADVCAAFRADYDAMLDAAAEAKRPTAVCTIYDPLFDDDAEQRAAVSALSAFNDVITRAAVRRGLPVIDLRVLFDSPGDYANPIEPSAAGGEKLARAIAALIAEHDFTRPRALLYAGGR